MNIFYRDTLTIKLLKQQTLRKLEFPQESHAVRRKARDGMGRGPFSLRRRFTALWGGQWVNSGHCHTLLGLLRYAFP